MTPFYDLYPKDPAENLRWRIRCREAALVDANVRRALYDACLTGNTLVVTDRGLVPISEVTSHHRVWDGTMWVSQDGCIYRGERKTISAYGIRLTPDHQVFTVGGWRDASDRLERAEIRLPDGYREKWFPGVVCGLEMSMRLRERSCCGWPRTADWAHEELRMLPEATRESEKSHPRSLWRTGISLLGEHGGPMHEPNVRELSQLRSERNYCVPAVADVRELSGGYGGKAARFYARSHRQRRKLRARELPLGNHRRAGKQPTEQQTYSHIAWCFDTGRSSKVGRCDSICDRSPHQARNFRGCDPVEAVYDLLNCGPRAAFTVIDSSGKPLLVHNCMLDVLFWMGFACWSFEPRAKVKIRPFIPWVHQEQVFVRMDEAVDESEAKETALDVIVDKARAQGGTFGYLWIDLRRWLRDPMFSAGYVTRNEMLVDSKTDSDTLFWKLDWAINRLPFWMVPEGFDWGSHRSYSKHSLLNPANGASLVGYSAGQDVGTGGRKTVFTIDEAGARDFVSGAKDEAIQESLHDVTNCVAAGTLVVTDRGLIPIEAVELHHRVWDGTMWVSHHGCVYQGERETIHSYRVNLTPDHLVLTKDGWKHASDQGFDRADIRLPDGYQAGWDEQVEAADVAVSLQVRCGEVDSRLGVARRPFHELRLPVSPADAQDAHLQLVGCDGPALHESEAPQISDIRRARDHRLRSVEDLRELRRGHGGVPGEADARPQRQRRELRAGELPLGQSCSAAEQQAKHNLCRDIEGQDGGRGCSEGGRIDQQGRHWPHQEGLDGGCSFASTQNPTAVYDLLNCGPRAAFTVVDGGGRPLLVHNCLRMVSARYVDSGVFNNACENHESSSDCVYLVLAWQDNPIHGKNSYVFRDGKPIARKPEEQAEVDQYFAENPDVNRRLERRGFKAEGVVRSPWYNMRCLRPTSTPRLIASQLDRDPRGAVGKVFTSDLLDRMKREHMRKPVWQGQAVFDSETLKLNGLIPRDDGPLKLWFKPGLDNSPPLGPFTIGCDMAAGSDGAYASNSVASIVDDRTGEQVGEYAIKGLELIKFARVVAGLCVWLRNAFLGWEESGMSAPFAKEIMEVICYGNVYYREVSEIGSRRKSRKAGWSNRKSEDKADLFEKMALGMETGRFIPRSEDLIRECGEYEWEKGKIIHAPTKNRNAVETNHGDRCVAGGVAWLIYSEDRTTLKIDTTEETGDTPEYGSFLWREQQERERMNSADPEFGIRDILAY